MGNIYDVLFILQLLVIIGVLFLFTYNLVKGNNIDPAIIFMALIAQFIAYGLAFVVVILKYDIELYTTLFQFEGWLFSLCILLFIATLLTKFKVFSGNDVKPYMSKER